jgi:hypothetical protein
MLSNKGAYTQKPYSVAWVRDDWGVYRAREVIVPKVEEVSITKSAITGTERIGL